MLHTLRRYLAAALAACALALPASAQNTAPTTSAQPTAAPQTPERSYVAEYVLAILAIGAVLIVVCMPSRKQV